MRKKKKGEDEASEGGEEARVGRVGGGDRKETEGERHREKREHSDREEWRGKKAQRVWYMEERREGS